MKLEVTNKNYSAQIVKLTNPRKHSNADRLLCWAVNGCNVITDLSYKDGDLVIYFPVESRISFDFLSKNSLFRDCELNADKTVKNFFEKNSRVRSMKLRGEYSEGFAIRLDSLSFLGSFDLKEGDTFNLIDGNLICEKYEPMIGKSSGPAKAISLSKFVPGQFKFHEDTENFGRSLRDFSLNDIISISYKLHGTSFTARRCLVKGKKFLFWQRKPHYELVASSRKVVKDLSCKEDLWVQTCEQLKGVIFDGLAIYGEIVGYNNTGRSIQGKFDYGCDPSGMQAPKNKIFIYRINYTSQEGRVFEYSTTQIQQFCKKFGLETPPVFYIGSILDYCNNRDVDTEDDNWRQNFLAKLKEEFNEKDCHLCKNKVPEEGVVIRKEGLTFDAYKLKSSRFLLMETEALDKGEEILS